jgi:Fe2+ transport system protein B
MNAGDEKELSEQATELNAQMAAIDHRHAEAGLRYSIAGRIGTVLEPITQLAGFDWRTNIALVGGFAAKEVVVSTLGTAYSLGGVDPSDGGSFWLGEETMDTWITLLVVLLGGVYLLRRLLKASQKAEECNMGCPSCSANGNCGSFSTKRIDSADEA